MAIQGLDRVLVRLEKLKNADNVLMPAVDAALTQLEGAAKANASGPRPEHIDKVTSNLVNQIQKFGPERTANGIEGGVRAGADYSDIHEHGGHITAKNAPALVFQLPDGSWRRVKAVTIPARPFMSPALKENQDQILQNITAAFRSILS